MGTEEEHFQQRYQCGGLFDVFLLRVKRVLFVFTGIYAEFVVVAPAP
jgi:hypothetical protein